MILKHGLFITISIISVESASADSSASGQKFISKISSYNNGVIKKHNKK
jgi:hypothetical protein